MNGFVRGIERVRPLSSFDISDHWRVSCQATRNNLNEMSLPLWVHILLVLPTIAILVAVGLGVNWWVAGIFFGPLVLYEIRTFLMRRRFANRNANPS